jgi:hypothetical protein
MFYRIRFGRKAGFPPRGICAGNLFFSAGKMPVSTGKIAVLTGRKTVGPLPAEKGTGNGSSARRGKSRAGASGGFSGCGEKVWPGRACGKEG